MIRDPMRWSEPSSGISSDLRMLLDSVAVDEPSAAQLDRVSAGLAATLGVPAPTSAQGGSASAAVTATGGLGAGKLALVLGIVAAVATGVGVWLLGGARAQVAAAPPPLALVEDGEPVAAAHPRLVVTQAVEPPPPPPASAAPAAPRVAAPPPAPAPSAAQVADDEVSILRAAQTALASDPTAALAHAERHAARFPRGVLLEEREAIAIEALVGLDRLDDARARFARFVAAFPRSGYRVRLARRLDQK